MGKKTISGMIFDIQRSSMYDGPGIRTAVFLSGCPLRCQWCHNPESQSFHPVLGFFKNRCTLCRSCEIVCEYGCHRFSQDTPLDFINKTGVISGICDNPTAVLPFEKHFIDRISCITCGKCVQACKNDVLKIYGEKTTPEAVMEIILKDQRYYALTNGGVTFTGGEPFSQPDFLMQLLQMAKEAEIHTCVETSGFIPENQLRKSLEYIDLFLFDFKASDPDLHKTWTGADTELIKSNFNMIYRTGKNIILRCPIIPGYNDTRKHFMKIVHFQEKYPNLEGIEIMPYHNLGESKAEAIGKSNNLRLANPTQTIKESWKETLRNCGASEKIINSF